MNIRTNRHRRGFTLVELLVVIAIIVALAALATPQIFKALKRAAMAEAISNVKQVKLALDSFAMDFDGQYPNSATESRILGSGGGGGSGGTLPDSNTAFRLLFWTSNTQSEKIFWVKGSPVATRTPDDKITDSSGDLVETEILPTNTCHWAYIQDQSNVSNPSRPLVIDPYAVGAGTADAFDPNLWDKKAIVLRIDSSARAERLGVQGQNKNKIIDDAGDDIFAPTASAWVGSGLTPSQLLVQPEGGS